MSEWIVTTDAKIKLRYRVIAETEAEAIDKFNQGEAESYSFDVDEIREEELECVDRVTG